jgi:hypothetical protein
LGAWNTTPFFRIERSWRTNAHAKQGAIIGHSITHLLDAGDNLLNHGIGAVCCLSGHLRLVIYLAILACNNSA